MSPWSVKGVEPDAREAAKTAARRAGMTVGQWLSATIRAAAIRPSDGATAPEPMNGTADSEETAAREARAAAQRAQALTALSAAAMEEALRRLGRRLDGTEPAGDSRAGTGTGRPPSDGPVSA